MITFYDFGAASAPAGLPEPIALASRTTTSGSISSGNGIPYNNEVYDNAAAYSSASSPSDERMAAPTTALYRLGVGSALSTTFYRAQKTRLVGTNIHGGYGATTDSTANPRWHSGWSAPISVTASDYLHTINEFGAGVYGADGANTTWLCLERLPSGLKYARVRKSADQTSFTSGNLSFDTEDADTDGWHDTVTDNDRLTVPSGVTRVRVLGNMVTGSYSGHAQLEIQKGGVADVVGCPSKRVNGTGNKLINLFGPPINVSSGNYFTLAGTLASSSSILAEQFTWFAIEEVPSGIKSALVYNSSGHGLTTTDAVLTWDSEDHDPDAMHSTGSNTSRLTVPSGCTYARVFFHIKGQSGSTAYIWAQLLKNGAGFVGTGLDARPGLSGAFQRLSGVSAWVQVSPGDYFEVQARVNTGSITTTGGWLAMECI